MQRDIRTCFQCVLIPALFAEVKGVFRELPGLASRVGAVELPLPVGERVQEATVACLPLALPASGLAGPSGAVEGHAGGAPGLTSACSGPTYAALAGAETSCNELGQILLPGLGVGQYLCDVAQWNGVGRNRME